MQRAAAGMWANTNYALVMHFNTNLNREKRAPNLFYHYFLFGRSKKKTFSILKVKLELEIHRHNIDKITIKNNSLLSNDMVNFTSGHVNDKIVVVGTSHELYKVYKA